MRKDGSCVEEHSAEQFIRCVHICSIKISRLDDARDEARLRWKGRSMFSML